MVAATMFSKGLAQHMVDATMSFGHPLLGGGRPGDCPWGLGEAGACDPIWRCLPGRVGLGQAPSGFMAREAGRL